MTIWDRGLSAVAAAVCLGLIVFLLVRNEPFTDPNFVVAMRVMLSLAAAIFGATIPGFLKVSWRGAGLVVRAGGALALFALTFLYTPQVLPLESTSGPNSPIFKNIVGPLDVKINSDH
jgi:hypothetical protein